MSCQNAALPPNYHVCYREGRRLEDTTNHHDHGPQQNRTLTTESLTNRETSNSAEEATDIVQRGHRTNQVGIAVQFERIQEIWSDDHTTCNRSVRCCSFLGLQNIPKTP